MINIKTIGLESRLINKNYRLFRGFVMDTKTYYVFILDESKRIIKNGKLFPSLKDINNNKEETFDCIIEKYNTEDANEAFNKLKPYLNI